MTKTFLTLSRFWILKGLGLWVSPLKKENLHQNLFQIKLNEVLKRCKKMIPADIKSDTKQEIKELVHVSHNFSQSTFSKLEIQCKTGLYFQFNPGWHSIQLDIVR